MVVNINIHAAEWTFEEELPFDIVTIKNEDKDFELPLYDKDDNEIERVTLPNCKVLELLGDEESFLVVIEKDLIKEEESYDIEDTTRVFNFAFNVDMPLWNQGEDIGVFYSWKNLPESLKDMKFGK